MKMKMEDRGVTYHFGKVLTAVFMAAALVTGTFTGTALSPVTAAYALTQPEQLGFNTGHRDTVCTELSSAALKYYSGRYSIEKLQAMSGDELKSSLHDLMADTDAYSDKVSYSNLKKYFAYTDAEDGNMGMVLFYSDEHAPATLDTQQLTSVSREHVWPKARGSFHETRGGADLHHLRPSDSIVNSKRGDYCFGYVDKNAKGTQEDRYNNNNSGKIAGWINKETDRFEPLDNVKGDVARILLFVYVRWEEPNLYKDDNSKQEPDDKKNEGTKVIESLDTLFEWMELDPVDTWEMCRNDLVQKVQGNRNVFIDHPELAYAMFGRTAPDNVAIGKAEKKDTDPHPTISQKTLTVGRKAYQIMISDKAADAVIKYKSSNKKIAKVTKTGKIKPVKEGQATITVTISQNGKKFVSKIVVTVKAKK